MASRRPLALAACLLALACSEGTSTPVAPEPARPPAAPARREARVGLWVLAEGSQRVLANPSRVPALLADAAALGATDLFVQVHRGGRAWFDSSLADATPFREARDAAGTDPLRELVRGAHAAGLRVHAWVNVLSLAGNREAPILAELGPGAVHVDRRGRSILDWPDLDVPEPERALVRIGTPAVWLDPAAPGVADRLVATFAELAARYPELDGLHLDYIRYPDVLPFSPGARFGVGIDFGYGEATRALFESQTGQRAPGPDGGGDADAWDTWRRAQVTALVRRIGEQARAVRPGLALSAAVSAYPERAYLSLFQDWRGWLDEGLLDFAVAMLYTRDDRLLGYEARAYARGVGGERVWIGLGPWLFAQEPARAATQRGLALGVEPAGIALFSWDAIADEPALRAALEVTPRSGP